MLSKTTRTAAVHAAKRRIIISITLSAIGLLAVAAAVTYAWFTGRAASTGNRLQSGSMNLELLTTSPTNVIEAGTAPTELSPAGLWKFKNSALADCKLRSFFQSDGGAMREIVSIGDNPHSLLKFLEETDALPGLRQQRPILVYNPNDGEATYTLDFVTRAIDGQGDLSPAFYFNCTPLGMRVGQGADQKPQYTETESDLTMNIPAAIFEGIVGVDRPANHREELAALTTYEALTPLLRQPDPANGAGITPVDADRLALWADWAPTQAKRDALTAVLDTAGARTIRIKPHCYHVYMMDMGLYPTAGNSYQSAGLTLDIVLTAQQAGDTVHRVYDESELARAITDNAVKAKANGTAGGDTILLMQNIVVTEPLPAYKAVFNLVLDGHTLTFGHQENGAGEATSFGSLLVSFPEVAATMEIGSPTGGRIVNADRMHFEAGSAPCVLTWYDDLCFRETSDGSSYQTALSGPADTPVDQIADAVRHPGLASPPPQIFGLGAQDTANADFMGMPASFLQIVDSPKIQVELRRVGG